MCTEVFCVESEHERLCKVVSRQSQITAFNRLMHCHYLRLSLLRVIIVTESCHLPSLICIVVLES